MRPGESNREGKHGIFFKLSVVPGRKVTPEAFFFRLYDASMIFTRQTSIFVFILKKKRIQKFMISDRSFCVFCF